MGLAGEIADGAHLDTGGLHIDQKLGQPLVFDLAIPAGAEQADHEVAEVAVGGPDLGAGEAPAAVHFLGPGLDGGEVRSGIGFAEADAERRLALDDLGQKALALLFGAEAQQQGAALAVAKPVGAEGCAHRQHFLHHHIALQMTALATAVLFGPGHANPALGAHGAAEVLVEAGPGVADFPAGPVLARLGEEVPHPLAQGLQCRRDFQRFEGKG